LTLILHESRLVLDRTNTYLLSTAFLLAAYGVSLSSRNVMAVAIPVIGIALSLVHPFLIARTIRALEFWRSTAALVERDPDYWFPGKVLDGTRSDEDLDFLMARQRRARGESSRQDEVPMPLGRAPRIVMRLQSRVPDPNTIFSTWLPTLMGALWMLALIVAASATTWHDPAGIPTRTTTAEPPAVVVPALTTPEGQTTRPSRGTSPGSGGSRTSPDE